MSLTALQVRHLRCIEAAELELHPRCTLIWGGNGAGKTTILEAAFLLGRGRSFRTRHTAQLIRHGSERLTVWGRTDGRSPHTLGLGFHGQTGAQARVDGADIRTLAALTLTFPVQVIDPDIHKLIEEGGRRRRRWLDWAVFHVEPQFGDAWYRYARALRQRNAAFKSRPADARPWEAELSAHGECMSQARRAVTARLEPHWQAVLASVNGPPAQLHYVQGWPEGTPLQAALLAARDRDERRQTTTVGPHRADIRITVAGKPAREVLSRGQQKLMAAALTLAQLRLLSETAQVLPTLLLDDPAAELDAGHQAGFVTEIARLGCQLVVTALQPEIPGFTQPDRVFHVERGCVRPV